VSVEELVAYHQAADVLVYPYSKITTSGALATGLGYGKAVLASDLPAFRQILDHNSNALMIPHEDVEGWAKALMRIVSDDDLRAKLSWKNMSDRARTTDWDVIATETLNVYDRCLKGNLREPRAVAR
jgi:glycosyltransferase involved in cell wall biosynthesis